jgi:2,4-dienoyl-CoA reductase-like NADH-dependent reductase (Old Yellow Enzyme family)
VTEIEDIIARFASTATALCEAGFDGVQIHAAHGYLISEFLNPLVNQREDEWGGSLDNRARLLIETVRAVRAAIGPDKALSVKLNSSDFQQGGFSFEDCKAVVTMLDGESIDLLEISGGNYEQPKMMGMDGVEPVFEGEVRESTKAREAYFMAYAEEIIQTAKTPIMVTGGFRSRAAMEEALSSGVAMLGIARPLCVHPDLPNQLITGEVDKMPAYEKEMFLGSGFWGPTSSNNIIKAANVFANMAFFYRNILRIADGKKPKTKMGLLAALIAHQMQDRKDAKTH